MPRLGFLGFYICLLSFVFFALKGSLIIQVVELTYLLNVTGFRVVTSCLFFVFPLLTC